MIEEERRLSVCPAELTPEEREHLAMLRRALTRSHDLLFGQAEKAA